jgi:hypothetical protein
VRSARSGDQLVLAIGRDEVEILADAVQQLAA